MRVIQYQLDLNLGDSLPSKTLVQILLVFAFREHSCSLCRTNTAPLFLFSLTQRDLLASFKVMAQYSG